MENQPLSVYLHIPFCRHRCAYCDFNTYAGLEELIPAYVDALCEEIRWIAGYHDHPENIHTIFLGGGTPSLLSIDQVAKVLKSLEECFHWEEGIEITMEANPGSLSQSYLKELHRSGVNRISLGMQSANAQDLRVLERQHDLVDVANSLKWARLAGFDNINLDLIYGLPSQTLVSWQNSLSFALSLEPEHLSLYSLSIEHGTMMANWYNRGLISIADPDLAADMFDHACERLDEQDFDHYEISNWAKKRGDLESFRCRHNIQYWRSLPYLGLGAGAHGFSGEVRTMNTLTPAGYIKRMLFTPTDLAYPGTPATVSQVHPGLDESIGDFMMMGLRLLHEGISKENFKRRFGITLEEKFGFVIDKLTGQGLVEWADHSLVLSKKGVLLGNRVFVEFI